MWLLQPFIIICFGIVSHDGFLLPIFSLNKQRKHSMMQIAKSNFVTRRHKPGFRPRKPKNYFSNHTTSKFKTSERKRARKAPDFEEKEAEKSVNKALEKKRVKKQRHIERKAASKFNDIERKLSPKPRNPPSLPWFSSDSAVTKPSALFFMARKSFQLSEVNGFDFAGGFNFNEIPDFGLPEVAFLGRSNVGKSSMLNALAGSSQAVVSKTPGRTQRINMFKVSDKKAPFMIISDLPGYGFATTMNKAQKSGIDEFLTKYITEREQLCLLVMLVDSRLGVQRIDLEAVEFFREQDKPLLIVATKMDKLNCEERHSLDNLRVGLGLLKDEGPLPFSAVTREGVSEAWELMGEVVKSAIANSRKKTS